MNSVDILITDISSLFFDYLLLDKPIIFMFKDKKFYKKIPLVFNYKKFLPGPIVSDWTEALEIEKLRNNDLYSKKEKYFSTV